MDVLYISMTKNILVTGKIPEVAITLLTAEGYRVDYPDTDRILNQEKLIEILTENSYDAVISFLTDTIDASVFASAPSVKIYSNYASGFDNVDIVEAEKRNIVVCNSPAPLSAEAVAEHTIALMLGLASRIVEADLYVRAGKYTQWTPMNFIGTDILGKTLGLIGTGRIGQRVAYYASRLGMKVVYNDIHRNESLEKECHAIYCESIADLLKQADVVSLHVPLLPSTRHLISTNQFALMKQSGFLINTSRGPVVDEKALVDALQKKIIGGVALDVFEFEPNISPQLIAMQNVILTPHIASASMEARNQMAEIAAQNIIDFFEGRVLNNKVH